MSEAGTLFDMALLPEDPFAGSGFPATDAEKRIASLIWQHRGRRNPVSIAELQRFMAMDDRSVKAVVEKLRKDHRLPIGARRTEPAGYFVVVDAEDEKEALEPYWRQILSELETVRSFTSKRTRLELAGQCRLVLEREEEGGKR